MGQKHNQQLHTDEYSIEYSAHGQQLISEVIFSTLDPAQRET